MVNAVPFLQFFWYSIDLMHHKIGRFESQSLHQPTQNPEKAFLSPKKPFSHQHSLGRTVFCFNKIKYGCWVAKELYSTTPITLWSWIGVFLSEWTTNQKTALNTTQIGIHHMLSRTHHQSHTRLKSAFHIKIKACHKCRFIGRQINQGIPNIIKTCQTPKWYKAL